MVREMVELNITVRVGASTLRARITRLRNQLEDLEREGAKLAVEKEKVRKALLEAERVYQDALSRGLITPPKPKGDTGVSG